MLQDEGIFQLPLHQGLECRGEIGELLIEREALELIMREQADCRDPLLVLHWAEKSTQPATRPVVAAVLQRVESSLQRVRVMNRTETPPRVQNF